MRIKIDGWLATLSLLLLFGPHTLCTVTFHPMPIWAAWAFALGMGLSTLAFVYLGWMGTTFTNVAVLLFHNLGCIAWEGSPYTQLLSGAALLVPTIAFSKYFLSRKRKRAMYKEWPW